MPKFPNLIFSINHPRAVHQGKVLNEIARSQQTIREISEREVEGKSNELDNILKWLCKDAIQRRIEDVSHSSQN